MQDETKKKPKISLQHAITKGNLEIVEELLTTWEKSNDLSEPINSMGTTLFHLVAEKGESHLDILKILVRHRVLRCGMLDMVATGDYTPLHYATRTGSTACVEVLLRNGAFVSAKDKFGNTPLHIAVENGFSDMVLLLIKYGASIQAKNKEKKIPSAVAKSRAANYTNREDSTLNEFQLEQKKKYSDVLGILYETSNNRNINPKYNIFYAAASGDCDLLEKILDSENSVVNTTSNVGHSPLFLAVKNKNTAAVDLLLSKGADPRVQNTFGTTVLHKAIENDDLNTFATLLAHRAAVHIFNREGKLPIDIAVSLSKWDMVSALIERHIEDSTEAGYFVKFIVKKLNHVLRQATRDGEVGIVQMLLRTRHAVNINENTPSGWTGLHLAIKHQQLELVKFFLKNKAEVNTVLAEGFTALHMAAELPIDDITKSQYLRVLLKAGANPNAATLSGYTTLHMLVKKGQVASCRVLLESGHVDPNLPHPYLSVPYYMAVKHKFFEVAELLIRHGSTIENAGTYPLLHAVRCGHVGIAEEMVAKGVDPNMCDPKSSWTPLGLAVLKESATSLVRKLIEAGAEINYRNAFGYTALHSACSIENVEVVDVLLQHGADVNIPNNKDFSPLHTALTLKNAKIVKLLIRAGADLARPFPKSGTLPSTVIAKIDNSELIEEFLHFNIDIDPAIRLCTAIRSGQSHLVKFLISERGLSLNQLYNDSSFGDERRPLSYTIRKNNNVDIDMVQYLVSLGANASLPLSSSSKRTLLHLAVDMKHETLFNYLLSISDLDLNYQEKNGWTALNVALAAKNESFGRRLIEAGADVNIPNDLNITPLHQAVSMNNLPLVTAVLDAGATPNVRSFSKMSPLDYALRGKYWDVALFLLQKEANLLKNRIGRSSWSLLHFMASQRGVDSYVISETIRIMTAQTDNFPINQTDNNGWTAVHLAVRNFNREAVEILIQAGADVTIATNVKWTPLHTIGKLGNLKSKKKSGPHLTDNVGPICDLLIDALKGTPTDQGLNKKGENGFTPLDIALFNENTLVAEKLRGNGAISTSFSTNVGLHHAAESGNLSVIRTLGSNLELLENIKGTSNWTPLHVASWYGNDKVVQLLIELGSNVFAKDKEGKTALHLALQKRRRRVIRHLMTAGGEKLAKMKDNSGISVLDNAPTSDQSLVSVIDRFINKGSKHSKETISLRKGQFELIAHEKSSRFRRERRVLNKEIGTASKDWSENLDV